MHLWKDFLFRFNYKFVKSLVSVDIGSGNGLVPSMMAQFTDAYICVAKITMVVYLVMKFSCGSG